jgi:glycine oxidase
MPIYIVGGGLIGLLSAHELQAAGRNVVLLERGQIGQQASWAGGGILSPLYPWRYPDAVTQLAIWGRQQYPILAASLAASTGIDAEWIRSGVLIFGAADRDEALAWAKAHDNQNLSLISGNAAARIEPAANRVDQPVLWDPSVAQIRNPRLLKALRRRLVDAGVEIRENQAVVGFSVEEGRLSEIRFKDGRRVTADLCVIAAGAWSAELCMSVGLRLPVRPVRGQMLLLRAGPNAISHMLMKDARYVIPRRDGRILVGSTLEEVGFDLSTTEDARQNLWQAAIDLAPSLADCPLERHWAGIRPGSPDGIPYIGEHPGVRGLYVCTGHYRNGIILGPGSARLLGDLILGRPPLWDPSPYAPKGF